MTHAAWPFHAGEERVQARLGVRDAIEPWARRVVRPLLPEPHRAFYAQLPFVVMAARDARGRPWATLLAGGPGFLSSPDPATLRVAALPEAGDALAGAPAAGADVGLLGIELDTRRRNRVNGRVAERSAGGLVLSVGQSFGNCPQHISERRWRHAPPGARGIRAVRDTSLSSAQRRWIEGADTFFVATGYREPGAESASFGMDASHRGGAPGFVAVVGPRHLVFPDYAGNNHFNTIGNLVLDPRIGLVFVDFERGGLLQLTGRAEIDWTPSARARERFPAARRLVRVAVEEVVARADALPLRFEAPGEAVRELRLVGRRRESADVTSFVFAARDGGALPAFEAGQYLPLELAVPGQAAPVVRAYSLSGPPDPTQYRISVKRHAQGLASRHLHDRLRVGALVAARPPRGDFVLDASSGRPVVLVGAGVGLTPLVSMLYALVADGRRRVLFLHGVRDGAHAPLRGELSALAAAGREVRLHVAYSRPRSTDAAGRDYQSAGRIDAALLEKLAPGLDADFYVCGPAGLLAAIRDGLEARGVPAERIHGESFGPAA